MRAPPLFSCQRSESGVEAGDQQISSGNLTSQLGMKLTLTVLEGSYTVHRFSADAPVPETIEQSKFYSVTRTDEELSLVCESSIDLNAPKSETDWRIIRVVGPLDFSLTGVLAEISSILASAGVSIFAVSTFDTDYIFVREYCLKEALKVIKKAGHNVA